MNQWLLSLQKGIKTIKYWNYRLDEHGIWLANRLFKCIYQPLFSTRFLIWIVFSRVIIQFEIRQKIWFHFIASIGIRRISNTIIQSTENASLTSFSYFPPPYIVLYAIHCAVLLLTTVSICMWSNDVAVSTESLLTHFSPVSHFYTPWKRQKVFWRFQGV